MIDVRLARELLDFGRRIQAGPRAEQQLEGAVALHNLLTRHGVAYLADEVGMGKTYVALGALALFRHFNPRFRVLVLAPRENIQRKWMKELGNFVGNNVRHPDLRMKGIDGSPARELVRCDNLIGLVRESTLNPDRDFFCRLTSFSLPLTGPDTGRSAEAKRLREELRGHFPWLPREVFDLRDKEGFKEHVARAICCVLPTFDLVIVDEAHNLKHGFAQHASARNRVLGLAFGHPDGGTDPRLFKGYGSRARKVLFLSATPVEDSYLQLWNQLDLFGRGGGFMELGKLDVADDVKKEVAARFLIRRVTEMHVGGRPLTKNLYRQEWRNGGVTTHDEPIRIEDARQRLTVALVQKKVSEILQGKRFGNSFQMGMLASFESFLETAKLKASEEDAGNFDGTEQTEDAVERDGIDVADLNRLARSHRERFGTEMPHPKMDSLLGRLDRAWRTGEKSLVFVRRVASVRELKRKLDDQYDRWLKTRLREELPPSALRRLERAIDRYERERLTALNRGESGSPRARGVGADDHGGQDTFFAWFLRGAPPLRVLAGTPVRERHSMPQSATFEDNYVALVLGCMPEEVTERMAQVVGQDAQSMRQALQERSQRFLRPVLKLARGDRFESVQAAAVEWLKDTPGPHQPLADVVWRERFEPTRPVVHATAAPEVGGWLECRTFFTELRRRPELRERLWPEPMTGDIRERFRDQELRARLLSTAARLGHAFIDLYVLTIRHLGSLKPGTEETGEHLADGGLSPIIEGFLDRLESQRVQPLAERGWAAFDELAQIAAHFGLILDVNAPDVRSKTLGEVARRFGTLLSRQQPVGGMAGQVNQTLVGQFRMPGYPFVLITTDVLQEGEDLHTFCSSVHHYGISWTPSSMEQRIGRIDRVSSQTDRRLTALKTDLSEGDKLSVFFPHLQDTVEVVQVRRLLTRMNTFLRLMHEGLLVEEGEDCRLDLGQELNREMKPVPQISERLQSAFQIRAEDLMGSTTDLAVTASNAEEARRNFEALGTEPLPGLDIHWEAGPRTGQLFGTVQLGSRQQPFTLLLRSFAGRLFVRCLSPVGRVFEDRDVDRIQSALPSPAPRIGVIQAEAEHTYDLTVEEDVLVPDDPGTYQHRVAWLVRHVTRAADDLERSQLPGADQPLSQFRSDLGKEMSHEP